MHPNTRLTSYTRGRMMQQYVQGAPVKGFARGMGSAAPPSTGGASASLRKERGICKTARAGLNGSDTASPPLRQTE